jgi:hypothetical protein
MKVYEKWEELAQYLLMALRSYPKSERYVLAADTRRACILVGRYIYRAHAVSALSTEKREMLRQADMALVDLKLLIRLGMLLGYLAVKKYEILIGYTTEIGKMLGGVDKIRNSVVLLILLLGGVGGYSPICTNLDLANRRFNGIL